MPKVIPETSCRLCHHEIVRSSPLEGVAVGKRVVNAARARMLPVIDTIAAGEVPFLNGVEDFSPVGEFTDEVKAYLARIKLKSIYPTI